MTGSRPNKNWWLYWIVPVSTCIIILGLVICFWIGTATSLHAERSLQAVILTVEVTEKFVRQEGRWPRSWDELTALEIAPYGSSWPEDASTVKLLVKIDFETDIETVAAQSEEEFDKILPTGSCYPYNDYPCVTALLRTVNEVVQAKK